jgi:hypothetical protein
LETDSEVVRIDPLGRSTSPERPGLDASAFLRLACSILGIDVERLASRRRDSETARLRILVVTVGIERWRQQAGALAMALHKHPDGVSRWVNRGARLSAVDPDFAKDQAELDEELSRRSIERLRRGSNW